MFSSAVFGPCLSPTASSAFIFTSLFFVRCIEFRCHPFNFTDPRSNKAIFSCFVPLKIFRRFSGRLRLLFKHVAKFAVHFCWGICALHASDLQQALAGHIGLCSGVIPIFFRKWYIFNISLVVLFSCQLLPQHHYLRNFSTFVNLSQTL